MFIIRRGVIERCSLFRGVLLRGVHYSEGCYLEVFVIRRGVIGRDHCTTTSMFSEVNGSSLAQEPRY